MYSGGCPWVQGCTQGAQGGTYGCLRVLYARLHKGFIRDSGLKTGIWSTAYGPQIPNKSFIDPGQKTLFYASKPGPFDKRRPMFLAASAPVGPDPGILNPGPESG